MYSLKSRSVLVLAATATASVTIALLPPTVPTTAAAIAATVAPLPLEKPARATPLSGKTKTVTPSAVRVQARSQSAGRAVVSRASTIDTTPDNRPLATATLRLTKGIPVTAQTLGVTAALSRTADKAAPSSADVTLSALQGGPLKGDGFAVQRLTQTGPVDLSVDVSARAATGGGNWFYRAQLVELTGCRVVKTSTGTAADKCTGRRPLTTQRQRTADGTSTLQAILPTDLSAGATTGVARSVPTTSVVVAQATGTSPAGSLEATPLGQQSSWGVGGNTGDFTWGYPFETPGVSGGVEPDLSISYSSAAVDGRLSTSNSQPSWIGDGFDLQAGYIERRYISCSDDMTGGNNTVKTGDLCWKSDNATMSLGGHSGKLVETSTDGKYVLEQADGTRITRVGGLGTANEYWKVTASDGTTYWFGSDADGRGTATNSAWSVPVFGNQPGEPCNDTTAPSTFAASSCSMTWRWNLDRVVDPNGNTMYYYYAKETNRYGANLNKKVVDYDRGGYLTRIEYGISTDNSTTPATISPSSARVLFTVAERCLPTATFDCAPAKLTSANQDFWPDVPFDRICTAATGSVADPFTGGCKDVVSPSFFSRKRLTNVQTHVATSTAGTAYRTVDDWTITHQFLAPGDGTDAILWPAAIDHDGFAPSGATLSAPTVRLTETNAMPNRVDTNDDGLPAINRFRIAGIDNGAGGLISVVYSPADCTATSKPADPTTNTRRCFPVYYDVGVATPLLEYFHKYVVYAVSTSDQTGSQDDTITRYRYLGAPAWHFDRDDITPKKRWTWGQWRGYPKVQTFTGNDVDGWTVSQDLFLRGMDDDCTARDCSTRRNVVVTDDRGGTIADADQFAGLVRENRTYATVNSVTVNATTQEVTAASVADPVTEDLTTPSLGAVLASDAFSTARLVLTTQMSGRQYSADGTIARTTTTSTSFNADGFPIQVDDRGDTATAADDVCTTTTYAVNRSLWILDTISSQISTAGACFTTTTPPTPTTPTFPDDLLSASRTYFDGATTWSATAVPTAGLPTRVDVASGVDANGALTYSKQATTVYDALGRPVQSFDAAGNQTKTVYTPTGAGPLTKVDSTQMSTAAAANQVTTTTYDPGRGSVLTITDPTRKQTTNTYDPLGQLLTIQQPGDPAGTPSKKFAYQFGVSARGTQPARVGRVTSSSLVGDGTAVTYLDSYAYYDGLGRTIQVQVPSADGDTASRIITHTNYDSRGLEWRTWGPVKATGAPGSGLATVAEGARPLQATTTYDAAGRTVKTTARAGVGSANWVNYVTTTAYDGPSVTVTPPAGGTITTTTTNARGQTTRLRQVTSARGATTPTTQDYTYTWTPDGLLAGMTDPAGNKWGRQYDIRRRLTSSTDPDAGTSTTTYDTLDRPRVNKDAAGRATFTDYDDFSRPIAKYAGTSTAGTLLASWTYDVLADGTRLNGLPVSSTSFVAPQPGATPLPYKREVVSYDAANRATSTRLVVPAGETGLAGTYTSTVDYNDDGTVKTQTLPASPSVLQAGLAPYKVTPTYDALGQPATASTGLINSTSYSAYGEPLRVAFGAGAQALTVLNTYEDGLRRLRNRVVSPNAGGGTYDDTTYTYDGVGNVTKIRDAATHASVPGGPDNQCFTYDPLQQLTQAWTPTNGDCTTTVTAASQLGGPAPYWLTWTYDLATGNRKSEVARSTAGTRTTNYTYPTATSTLATPSKPHQLQSIQTSGLSTGSATYTYNPAGDLTKIAATGALANETGTATWDTQGQLTSGTSSVSGSASTVTRVYDADGQLLLSRDATGSSLFVDGTTEMRRTASSGVVVNIHQLDWAAGVTTVLRRSSLGASTSFTISDPQGTGELSVNANTGQITGIRRTTPYGTSRTAASSWPTLHGYIDGVDDTTLGLVRLGARDYDPETGRFISTDPLLVTADPSQWNAYTYSGNNPTTRSDPTGMASNVAQFEGGNTRPPVQPGGGCKSTSIDRQTSGTPRGGGSSSATNVGSSHSSSSGKSTTNQSKPQQKKHGLLGKVAGFVKKHKATIIAMATEVAVFSGCTFMTAGAGVAACAVAAGAVGNLVSYAIATPPDQMTLGGAALSAGLGGAAGLLGAGLGAGLARVAEMAGPAVARAAAKVVEATRGSLGKARAAEVATKAAQGSEDVAQAASSQGTAVADSVSPTVGELRAAGLKDAHHIIQDAAVRDVPGYSTNAAPGVQLGGPSTLSGTEHYAATVVQRAAGGGTYGAERQIAFSALRAAGFPEADAASAVERADAYFMKQLGMDMDTPTRIPGNRARG